MRVRLFGVFRLLYCPYYANGAIITKNMPNNFKIFWKYTLDTRKNENTDRCYGLYRDSVV